MELVTDRAILELQQNMERILACMNLLEISQTALRTKVVLMEEEIKILMVAHKNTNTCVRHLEKKVYGLSPGMTVNHGPDSVS